MISRLKNILHTNQKQDKHSEIRKDYKRLLIELSKSTKARWRMKNKKQWKCSLKHAWVYNNIDLMKVFHNYYKSIKFVFPKAGPGLVWVFLFLFRTPHHNAASLIKYTRQVSTYSATPQRNPILGIYKFLAIVSTIS